ncbi:MAG: glycerate kinase [Leptolyngbyaceae cyanobacterium bins.349]|nr:glycerate kinase [Leptolyngbyaceae cyanobacterium bins.349]
MQIQIQRKSLVKSSDSLRPLLKSLLDGPSLPLLQELAQWELANTQRAAALGVVAATVDQQIHQRAALLRSLYPTFCPLCDRWLGNPADYLPTLWQLWIPLAQQLATQRQQLNRPLIQGILGGQGTGKTTLSAMLTLILQTLGYKTLSWSLDDLYKPYRDRLQLQQQNPQLIWRGPPGTHDVELGIQTLDHLRHPIAGQTIAIPRFDKSLHNGMGDRIAPEPVADIDIVLFEGWFVGVEPIAAIAFDAPPAPITTLSDRTFAQECNQRLADYRPLWQRLDRLWVLYLPDYHLSQQWRKQAEHQMKASGKPGMTDTEIDAFVEYFWKALHPDLFIRPACDRADLVIEINPDHAPGEIWLGSREFGN